MICFDKCNTGRQRLYQKAVPFTINNLLTNKCGCCELIITIEWYQESSTIQQKVLRITLTDNDDPFFFYNLHLSNENFKILKQSVKIIPEFHEFPESLIKLIEACLEKDTCDKSKYMLLFNIGGHSSNAHSGILDIVEVKDLNHVTNISLKFLVASEENVKKYLITYVKDLKEAKIDLQKQLAHLDHISREKIKALKDDLKDKKCEFDDLKKNHDTKFLDKDPQHAHELEMMRERHHEIVKDAEHRFEKERKKIEGKCKHDIEHITSEVSVLKNNIKDREDKIHQRERQIENQSLQIASLEKDLKRMHEERERVASSNESLSKQLQKHKRDLGKANAELRKSQNTCSYWQKSYVDLDDTFKKISQEKIVLEDNLCKMKTMLDNSDEEKNKFEAEMNKARQVLRCVRKSYLKLKDWANTMKSQLLKKIHQLKEMNEVLTASKQNAEKEIHHLKDVEYAFNTEIKRLNERLKAKETLIKKND